MASVLILLIVGVILLGMMVKTIPASERALIYRLGRRLGPPKGPGLILIIPVVDKVVRINAAMTMLEVPLVEMFTADGKRVAVGLEVLLEKKWSGAEAPAGLADHFHDLAQAQLAGLTLAELQARVGTNDPGRFGAAVLSPDAVGGPKAQVIIQEVIAR